MGIAIQAQDTVYGRGAAGLWVLLEHIDDGSWTLSARAQTDQDGTVAQWCDRKLERGMYRIVLDTDPYFVSLGLRAAYPEIVVAFRVVDETAVGNVQILLSPHSFSAYFGSLS
ncbi:hydroxyisourate hydrolase [Thermostaphylospora chromogena]|uniref:5-hydroxyisourate hydrolase n=1 Tax=Thermostaphylospora chromogena TaxID=35622 RepID=A0A1H0ZRE4_9ACTN|nr:hydroxyisourate hydrolase [Thermostaphylospora chromogena]SDQ29974.1 5-hydroxyisourate hydrolase [Thermostaphylospora chromogena]